MPRFRNPCSYLPRRLQIVASLTGFILLAILFLGGSSPSDPILDNVPYGPRLEKGLHDVLEHVPYAEQYNPFGQPIHRPPPEQTDSSHGDVRWFSDFKWRNPFSSSTTLDEERAVLPHLRERPRVYTYFDPTNRRKDEKSRQAEQDLLQIWRRAWWAQGFSPIVLGRPEAMSNPLYRGVENLKLKPELELEMMRWLAWGKMGTGIMCNWLALPMSKYNDPLLEFLRRGSFPELTRYAGLENGLFVGTKDDINQAIKTAMAFSEVHLATSLSETVPQGTFTVDSEHSGIAFYSSSMIGIKYAKIKAYLDNPETRSTGMAMLPPLINSHLQANWQSTFTSGIAVLKPLAKNTSAMVEPALRLARNLSQCSESPLPASCPPNNDKCSPCVSAHPMRVTTPKVFKNSSTLFTIGTVPHPYTFQALIHSKPDLDLPFIRRKTSRDVWITEATKELLGTGYGSFARLGPFKETVASEFGTSHSYWMTAENPTQVGSEPNYEELDFVFGFEIPRSPLVPLKSDNPVPSLDRTPPKSDYEKDPTSPNILALQLSLLERSKRLVKNGDKSSRDKASVRLRTIIEAWNLADTEAWKFVRAWNARRRLERKVWEEEEAKFLGKPLYDRLKDFMHP